MLGYTDRTTRRGHPFSHMTWSPLQTPLLLHYIRSTLFLAVACTMTTSIPLSSPPPLLSLLLPSSSALPSPPLSSSISSSPLPPLPPLPSPPPRGSEWTCPSRVPGSVASTPPTPSSSSTHPTSPSSCRALWSPTSTSFHRLGGGAGSDNN